MRTTVVRAAILCLPMAALNHSPTDAASRLIAAPVAKAVTHVVKSPHGDRVDEYYWMRDDDAKAKREEIIEHLNAENAYTSAKLAHVKPLQDKLVSEMRARIKEDDSSVPVYDNGYWYWYRFDTGAEYRMWMRRRGTPEAQDPLAPAETILDLPKLAVGSAYYAIGAFAVSPDNQWLAWTEDSVGRRMHTLRIKNLKTGETLPDRLSGVLESIVWAADNQTVFYIKQDPVLLQSGPVYRHRLRTATAEDTLVYNEPDQTLFTGIRRSASRKLVLIDVHGFDTTELLALDANAPSAPPTIILPRRPRVRSYADHLNGRWIIRTNDNALNFRLVEAPERAPGDRSQWKDIIAARDDAAIDDVALFNQGIVVEERVNASKRLRVLPANGKPDFALTADEPASTTDLDVNPDPASPYVRYRYESMTTPYSIYDARLDSGTRSLRKQQPVLGYDSTLYGTERTWALARDGKRIPVSIAYRKDRYRRDGSAPLYVLGYGSYAYSYDPRFSSNVVSLMDRGFAVAIAHIRGGSELGQGWYEDGRLMNKKNTFNDFVDATRFLVKERFGAADKVFASGGSAGGLLMGAVANQAGSLYRGIALHVPFVDVVTTMLDETIPLTINEWTQWGDPREKTTYDYMLSYSPYDNLTATAYPAMLVTTGLWDPQVQYFEPAKYVARLRARKTDANPLLFYINMQAGHSGKSGRFERLTEIAREYAFFLDLVGVRE
jgi:oligopeptidase B